jgi:translation elongation factor EF-1beta
MNESTKRKVYNIHRTWLKLEKAKDMKITEQTKIKDIIPEGYEFEKIEHEGAGVGIKVYSVYFKPKEKTFEDYTKDYYRKCPPEVEDFLMLNVNAEDLPIRSRFELLWYIVKDKGGTLKDLSDLLFRIAQPNEMSEPGVSDRVWKLLPQSFIESFKEE